MPDILLRSDMEKPRKPSELAEWYHQKHQEIRLDPEEVQKARRCVGLYRFFVPEIYPLMIYSLWRFPNDEVFCRPKIGNQGYDAEIWPIEQPNKIHRVEVTWPEDGKARNELMKILNRNGFVGWIGDEFDSYDEDIRARVISIAKKKSRIDYSSIGGSALLIVVDTQCSPFDEGEQQEGIATLANDLKQMPFRADEVYLITTPHEDVYQVSKPQAVKQSGGLCTPDSRCVRFKSGS